MAEQQAAPETGRSQSDAQWAEAVRQAGDQLRSRGWGVERLLSHNDIRHLLREMARQTPPCFGGVSV